MKIEPNDDGRHGVLRNPVVGETAQTAVAGRTLGRVDGAARPCTDSGFHGRTYAANLEGSNLGWLNASQIATAPQRPDATTGFASLSLP